MKLFPKYSTSPDPHESSRPKMTWGFFRYHSWEVLKSFSPRDGSWSRLTCTATGFTVLIGCLCYVGYLQVPVYEAYFDSSLKGVETGFGCLFAGNLLFWSFLFARAGRMTWNDTYRFNYREYLDSTLIKKSWD